MAINIADDNIFNKDKTIEKVSRAVSSLVDCAKASGDGSHFSFLAA